MMDVGINSGLSMNGKFGWLPVIVFTFTRFKTLLFLFISTFPGFVFLLHVIHINSSITVEDTHFMKKWNNYISFVEFI